jgi:DNA polymerase-1
VISYELVLREEQLGRIANEVHSNKRVGLDIETTAYSQFAGDIRLVQLNTGSGIYVIDLFETKTLGPVLDALASESVLKIIQNAKFEQKWFLYKYGLRLWPLFDTFRSSAMYYNGRVAGHNLYDLYRRELGIEPEIPDLGGSDWSGPLTSTQLEYAAEDVVHLLDLYTRLRAKLQNASLLGAALIEFGAIIGEAEIEVNGFHLDSDKWLELASKNQAKVDELRDQLEQMLPHPRGQLGLFGPAAGFNLNSTEQVKASFARLGIKVDSTAKEVLGMIASKHPVIPLFMKYRAAIKRVQSFGSEYLQHIDPHTGRIHTDFWPLTGAGRYSSSNPNLQQIPRTKDFRDCFTPPPGKKIVVCDYSQIELRITAEISRDPLLMQIYRNGEDAHQRTASIVAQVALDKVTKEQRQAAKPVNFGLIYSLGAEKLVVYSQVSYGVTISVAQAHKFIERYFAGYAGVREWHHAALREFKKRPCVRTLSGRLRWLDPERAHGEVFNTPVQGTGADALKQSLPVVWTKLRPYGDRARMVHTVHDEIVLEVDDDAEILAAAKEALEVGMLEGTRGLLRRVPVVADASVGSSWADK